MVSHQSLLWPGVLEGKINLRKKKKWITIYAFKIVMITKEAQGQSVKYCPLIPGAWL